MWKDTCQAQSLLLLDYSIYVNGTQMLYFHNQAICNVACGCIDLGNLVDSHTPQYSIEYLSFHDNCT